MSDKTHSSSSGLRAVPRWRRSWSVWVCGLLLALPALAAERPRIYAITGATIVTAPGEKLEGATIVLRDGLIESVGAEVSPPEDAVTIDGEGRWVYAGLIDVDSSLGVSTGGRGGNAAPGGGGGGFPGSRSRAPRPGAGHELSLVHPEQRVRDKLVPFEGDGAREMERIRELGFTAVLVTPTDGILRGRSSAILLAGDRTVPQLILRDDVAQHAGFQRAGFGGGYPTSLMGGAAALRQTFLDAERAASWAERYDDSPQGMPRPPHNAAFEALEPVLEGDQPLFFRTDDAQNSLLADRIAREFDLELVLATNGEEWEIAEQIASTERTLILPVGFPDKPKVKEEHEALNVTMQEMRRYLEAPAAAGVLHAAGVRFAFTMRDLKNSADLPKNMIKIIEKGLPADVALAAWTTVPAELMGLERVLGTLESGKIANLLVTDGPLFEEETKIRHVFVDGVEHEIEVKEKPKGDPNAVVDPRGEWSVTFEFGGRTIERTWTITGDKDDYAGTAETRGGTVEFDAVELAGNALTVTMPGQGGRGPMEITVIIEGESFEGTAEMGPRSVPIMGSRKSGPEGGAR